MIGIRLVTSVLNSVSEVFVNSVEVFWLTLQYPYKDNATLDVTLTHGEQCYFSFELRQEVNAINKGSEDD